MNLAVFDVILEVDVGGAGAETIGDVGECKIVCGHQADGAAIDEAGDEGFGTDPGLTSPAPGSPYNAGVSPQGNPLVGAHLFQVMDSLPPTDVEFGSVTTLGLATNALRDPFLYTQHVRPQIYVPGHMTDVQLVGSSLQSRKSFILTEEVRKFRAEPYTRRNCAGWLTPMILRGR